MGRGVELAVLGAVGLNGDNVLQLIGERQLPVSKLQVLDSDEFLGRKVDFGGKLLPLDSYNDFNFSEVDLAIVCGEMPEAVINRALEQGCTLIGPAAGAPHDDHQPIIADIDIDRRDMSKGRYYAVPPALGTVLATLLSPLHDEVGVIAVEATWISAVGNHGRTAIEGLAHETTQLLSGKSASAKAFSEKIAFNMLAFDVRQETSDFIDLWRTIWGDDIAMTLNGVIAPLFFGDLLSLSITLEQPMDEGELQQLLETSPWIQRKKPKEAVLLSSADSVGSDSIQMQSIQPLDDGGRRFSVMVGVDVPRFGFALNITKVTENLAKKLFISYS